MSCGFKQSSLWLKSACLAAELFLLFISLAFWTACGDVFRPVANPVPGPTPDPRNFHFAIVVSQNVTGSRGSGMQIDVSGDSNAGTVQVGQQPIYATLTPQGTKVFVANTDGTVSSFTPGGTFAAIGTPTSISLPGGLAPQFLYSTEANNMYVLATNNGGFTGCPNSVLGAISTTSDSVTQTACVGPDAGLSRRSLTETPDGRKLYVVNGDGTISSINTVDFSSNPPVSPASLNAALTTPVSVIASLDSSQVFVLDASGLISTIDTFTDLPVAVTTVSAGSGANFMYLERTANRLYVTSTASNTVSVFSAATQAPQAPALVGSPLTLPSGSTPAMITALPNGLKAYVLSANSSNAPVLTTLNTSNETIASVLALPAAIPNPAATPMCQASRSPFSVAAAANNSRLYVTNCFAGSTSILDATTNARILSMNSPISGYAPVGTATFPPPQNPVWVVAGP